MDAQHHDPEHTASRSYAARCKTAIAKGESVLSETLIQAAKVIVKQDKLLAAAGLITETV
jgi:hypothetical protein